MVKPSDKLSESLGILHRLQTQDKIVIRSSDLTRTHRERLCKHGFLQEVISGWYIPSRPNEPAGESTAWYTSFWHFCASYLQFLKGDDWCLSPEQSLSLHVENWTVPPQLLVRATKARNNVTSLPHGTSMLVIRSIMPASNDIVEKNGLRLFSLPAALVNCSPSFFQQNPTDARAALLIMRDVSEILKKLLEGGHSTVAGRLAGAFRSIGREREANEIVQTMRAAGYDIRESDPFEIPTRQIMLPPRGESPLVSRLRLMWQDMREPIISRFPKAPGLPKDMHGYLNQVEEMYASDAYNSLSIEGYRVNPELIDRVRDGNWNPIGNEQDREHSNALAARGYWLAYQAVKESIAKILKGENSGAVVDMDHGTWYREMFAPTVMAGLMRPADLAGYRNGPVYIRQSMHVPPSREAVRDAMSAFFDLLKAESEASVRVVLGHFIFVYIHPYFDGNGRIGRFLMNTMTASGGYPWIVVPLEKRHQYMAALEEASVGRNIEPFADFLARLAES
ncbi:MAG: Fic family protein [Oligoflexus sp.]